MPTWWPMFCLTADVVLAGSLAWLLARPGKPRLLARRAERTVSIGRRIRPFINDELQAALVCDRAGDMMASFRHLERAHVLGQISTVEHVRVQARMLAWGWRHQNLREIVAQVPRIIGAATMTALKAVPHGNTGGSNVSAFRAMPVPSDLAAIIASASTTAFSRVPIAVLVIGMLLAFGGWDSTPKDDRFTQGGGHRIAYRVLGSGQPVVVMIGA